MGVEQTAVSGTVWGTDTALPRVIGDSSKVLKVEG